MPKSKLNFRFQNANSAKDTAEMIAKIFEEAGKIKLEKVLQEKMTQQRIDTYTQCIECQGSG